MKKLSLIAIYCFSIATILPAQKNITVSDIWQKFIFRQKSPQNLSITADGAHYSSLENGAILKRKLIDNTLDDTLFVGASVKDFSDYKLSADESKILIATNEKQIYRHSSKANFLLVNKKTTTDIFKSAPQNNPTFNTQGTQIAFTSNNNLFVYDIAKNASQQITTDGQDTKIINGLCDWVYEEEFSFTRAFEWSPDGKKIAFLRFDESEVPSITLEYYKGEVHPTPYTFKYPKVGEKNSIVTVWVYDVEKNKTTQINTGVFEYFPRLKWTPENTLLVFALNRLQNEMTVLKVETLHAKSSLLFKESRPTFVDLEMNDDMFFLKDGSFVRTSEVDGWNHIYVYSKSGERKATITPGDFDVKKLYGIDTQRGEIYYQASAKSPMNTEVYAIHFDGSQKRLISKNEGTNDAEFTPNFDYYTMRYSTANLPPQYAIFKNDGSVVRVLELNQKIQDQVKEYNAKPIEFFTIPVENFTLNAWMIKPANFDASKKYPVLMTQYSGPNSQQVKNDWQGVNYWWYQMLAQQGYMIVCVDPRGTGGRGEAFRKVTYKQLGKYETADQISSAQWLSHQTYVDSARIGIFGWSYGGFMAASCMFKGADVFHAGISIAPVTNWKWYDSVYTERYMQTEKENADGYRDNSPVNFADLLKGKLLLCHGEADDNVHFQNTIELTRALIDSNKQFDTYFYPNLNHGIAARYHLYTKMTDFLMKNL